MAALFIVGERWQWHRVLGVIIGVGGVITIAEPRKPCELRRHVIGTICGGCRDLVLCVRICVGQTG